MIAISILWNPKILEDEGARSRVKYGGRAICWISDASLVAIFLTSREKIKTVQKSALNDSDEKRT